MRMLNYHNRTIIFWVIKLGSIICPICHEPGYLVRERGKYLRIAHNTTTRNSRVRFCYLGEERKYLQRLVIFSKIHPEQNVDYLIEKILKILPQKPEKHPSTEIVDLINQLKELYHRLRSLSDATEHKIRQRHPCPYCKKTIAVYAKRVGKPPLYSYRDFWLERWTQY